MEENVTQIKTGFGAVHYEHRSAGMIYISQQKQDMYVNIHDDLEVIYVSEGKLQLYIDDMSVELRAGEGIIVNGGCMHSGFVSESTCYDVVLVDLQQFCLQNEDREANVFQRFLDRELCFRPCILQEENAPEILSEIRNVIRWCKQRDIGWKLRVISSFYIIAALFQNKGYLESKSSLEIKYPQWKKDMELYKAFTQYVVVYYGQDVMIPQVASALQVSVSKLYKICVSFYGKPPVEYIYRYRLMVAAQMLKSTDASVTEICYSCGFKNLSYFIRKFCDIYEVTPYQFRKLNTKKC